MIKLNQMLKRIRYNIRVNLDTDSKSSLMKGVIESVHLANFKIKLPNLDMEV